MSHLLVSPTHIQFSHRIMPREVAAEGFGDDFFPEFPIEVLFVGGGHVPNLRLENSTSFLSH